MNEDADVIYERARELSPGERRAFLAEACRGNPALQAELESLLESAEEAERFFERVQGTILPTIVSDVSIGETIGHYRILSHIGSGGMGSVYRAHDTRLGRDVALKFLPPLLAGGEEAAGHVLAEARAAASLQHPNICVVHDVSATDDGRAFIAMALCDGETLKDRLRRGPIPVEEAVSIATQIARGLQAAHSRTIVHRDVKPGNIMVGVDGAVKLLDFGLAGSDTAAPGDSRGISGTAAYMSPEHLRGDVTGERSDLWALGVVFYEMLAGVRPFRGGDDPSVFRSILNDTAEPLSVHRAGIPDTVARIVERLIAKDPKARYQSASALLADLTALNRADAKTRSDRRALLIAGPAVAAGLAIFALLIQSRRNDAASAAASTTVAAPRVLTQNIAAWEFYLRGRDLHLRSSTDSGPLLGLSYLQQAVALDPKFAAAYAAMPYMYNSMATGADPARRRELARLADSTARLAVALDSLLPEAHSALALVKLRRSDVAGAEASFRRSIALGKAPRVREHLASLLVWTGRPEEGLAESFRAVADDPNSASATADLGRALCINGRYEEGLDKLMKLAPVDPPLLRTKYYIALCYALQHDWQRALAGLQGWRDGRIGGLLGYCLARAGSVDEARAVMEAAINNWKRTGRGALDVTLVAVGLRDYDQAFVWLQRSTDDLKSFSESVYVVRDELRTDPRFDRLLRNNGF